MCLYLLNKSSKAFSYRMVKIALQVWLEMMKGTQKFI